MNLLTPNNDSTSCWLLPTLIHVYRQKASIRIGHFSYSVPCITHDPSHHAKIFYKKNIQWFTIQDLSIIGIL